MAKSLAQIKKQIATLQRQAESLRNKEIKDVVARIKEAIAFYELTPQDLGLGGSAARRPAAKKSRATRPRGGGRIKFRDDAGHSWTGHGRRPQWFLDALASGKTEADLAA